MMHVEAIERGSDIDVIVKTILSGDGLELIDASDGWDLLFEIVDGELGEALATFTETNGRVIAVTRRSGGGIPFVLIARIPVGPRDEPDDDPWRDLGCGD